jgi:hypothetical protein
MDGLKNWYPFTGLPPPMVVTQLTMENGEPLFEVEYED